MNKTSAPQTISIRKPNLKGIQDQFRENQENFRILAQTAPALIYIALPDQERLLYVNQYYEEFMGYSIQECLAIKSYELIHPDFRQIMKDDSRILLQNKGGVIRREVKTITKNNRELWQDLSKTYIEFEGYPSILGIAYDITAQKNAEELIKQQNMELQASYNELEAMNEEIRESQEILIKLNQELQVSKERLELALWASNEGLWDWDFATGDFYVNERLNKMLGYDAQNFVFHIDNWVSIMLPEDVACAQEKLREHLQGKTDCYEIEYRLRTQKGDYIWVFDRGKAVDWDENGRATRIVGMRMDISDRKQAEKETIDAKNRYATLIAAIPELVIQTDLNWNFVWVNELARDFYGNKVLGTCIKDYFINMRLLHNSKKHVL